MWRHLGEARVARLATIGPDGRPHLVPITFTVEDRVIYFAVDAKPKRTTDLKRVRNIAANPLVTVLVDHYDDDWTRLWWVRADGTARVIGGQEAQHALHLLQQRYAQYRSAQPQGPVVAISVDRLSGWSAT